MVRITALFIVAGLILMSTPGHSAPPNPRVIQRYKEMLQANPVEGTALERLWNAFVEQGKTADLLEEYRQKHDFGSQMVLGHLLRRSGTVDLATAAFQRAAELDEKNPLPFLALGSLCEAEGQPRQAAEWSAKAVARIAPNDPRYIETLMELGTRWLAAGDLDEAAAAWEKTVGLDPENLAIRRRLAETYLRHQVNLPGAVTHFEYLTRHASPAERAAAFQQLARLHESAGKTDAAVAALESGLALTAPGNWLRAELQSQLIRLHQRHHLLDQLEVRWKERATANPRDAGGISQLVELYERTGDLEQKKVWLEKLVALTPKNTAQRLRLARLHVQLDEIDAAAALFDRLLAELPRDPDIILERARLDVQQGAAENARKRIHSLLSARADDQTVRPRALEFFEIHRMHDAAEALLTTDAASGREEAVLDLARFYFAQRRDADAHRTLAGLVPPTAAPEEQAAAHLRIAQTLKIRGEIENAAASARAAVALAEESREAQLVLGELAAAAGRTSEARAAFEKAYSLGKTAAEALEADQKLFDALRNPSAGLGESPAATPISGSSRTDDGQSISTPALQDLLLALTRVAAANPSVERWLRIARWNLWSRNPRVAQECAQQALTLDARSVEAHEFMVKLALADPQPQKAIGHLRELTKLHPENGAAYQRRVAQIEMQTGRAEEALRIFRELAAANPGNLDALNDLALAQQRSEQWEAALSTCRQILASSPPSRKKEAIAQLQRVYDRLRMPREAAALLLQQIDAQDDEGERFTLFRDLLAHCIKHQQLDWLRVELERRRRIRIEDYFLNVALGRTLKAAGDKAAAFTVIADAALSAPDPSETLPELVREAEDLRKLDVAVQLQAQLVRILSHPPAAAFEKLAQLQERNFDIETAARTWAKMTVKFPRDAGVLERAADFELKWGTPARALELLRKTRELEPGNLRALSALAELEMEFGAARNAEKYFEEILQIAPQGKTAAIRFPAWRGEDPGRLQTSYLDTVRLRRGKPNSEAMRALRSFWVSGDGRVNSESDLRLSAVRNLATLIEASGAGAHRERWVQRWRAASNAPSETLCALYHSGAHDALLDHLEAMMGRRESEPQTKQAFLWLALQTRAFARLSDWLRDPRRSASDRDFLLVALAQHLSSNGGQVDPALIERLFPPGFRLRIWQAAQMFANRGQFREAAQLGQRVFDTLSTQRAAYGVDLATWYLYIGGLDSARTVLRASVTSRGEAFDAPVYGALRQYWFLLPEPERVAFADAFLAGLDDRAEPLHAAICRTLLHGVAGRERIAQEQLRRVLDLGAMSHLSFDEPGTSASRVWEFILTAGTQLQSWKLDSLAVFLWENALADPAFIRLQAEAQGEQVQTRASEVRTRLAAVKIARADSFDRAAILEEYRRFAPRDGMVSLAEALESVGAFHRSIEICRQLWEAEPGNPQALRNMLNACRTAGDLQTLEMVLRRCTTEGLFRVTESGHRDLTLQLVEILEQRNSFSEARDILEETLRPPRGSGERSSPADHRLALRLAQLHERTGDIARAEQIYQQLLAREPGNTSARIALATLLTRRGAENEAVALLEKGAGVEVEGRLAAIYLKSGRVHDAIASLERLPVGAHIPATLQAASTLSERGQRTEALVILRNAVARTADTAAAFPLQSKIVELLHDTEDPSRIAREWRRLREMAGDDRNSMTAYFDLLVRHARRFRRVAEARDELTASWNEGQGSLAAGVASVEWALIHDDRAGSDELARQLLQRHDLSESIAQKLAALAVRHGRTELLINAQARLARVNPIDFSKIITWAETLHQHGKRADAVAALEELTWRAALNDEIAARVAETFLKFGEVAKARSLFEQAIATDHVGRNYRAHLGFARLSLSEGDHANAKKMLQIAFQHPANREMADLLHYLEKTGHLEDAERALRDIGLDETRAMLLRHSLFAHWIKEAKLAPLLKLIGEHPHVLDTARLVELRALAKQTGDFQVATQLLESLRLESSSTLPELNRELALLYFDWAESRLRQLDVEGAMAHLGRGRELAPANFALARRLSELLVERGQRSRAAETLDHFIAASDNRAEQESARQLLAKIRSP